MVSGLFVQNAAPNLASLLKEVMGKGILLNVAKNSHKNDSRPKAHRFLRVCKSTVAILL